MSSKFRGSGKQVLLKILSELSTQITNEDNLPEATRKARAGLLLHGSTAEESFEHVSRLIWASERDEDGALVKQGLALKNGPVFIADLYEDILEMPGLEAFLLKRHPTLDPADFKAMSHAIWCLVSSVQMFTQLQSVELDNPDNIDLEAWTESMTSKLAYHFRERGRAPDDE